MRFMLLMIPNVPEGEWEPDAADVEPMMRFNEELTRAGALLALDGFAPPGEGARVSFSGGEATVGPVPTGAGERPVGGYWIIDAASRDEAIDWARRVPANDGDQVEVRQIFELEDYPEDVQDVAQLSQEPPAQTKPRG
jgi:hypothetical protein